MLNAALILTIMTLPIITAVTREVFDTTPADLKEGAYALGATRWEMVRMVVLPYGRAGMTGAVILGLGRAIGEAIAVTQVIGNTPGIHVSLFAPAATLAAQIASEYQGATTHLQTASLIYLAAILLVMSLIVNIVARLIVRRTGRAGAMSEASSARLRLTLAGSPQRPASPPPEPPHGGLATIAAWFAVARARAGGRSVFAKRHQGPQPRLHHQEAGAVRPDGRRHRELHRRHHHPGRARDRHGGAGRHPHRDLHRASSRGPRVAGAVRFAIDILNGVPTIVTGIFVFALLVAGHQQSGFAGSVALAIVMLPIVARSAEEVLLLFPVRCKEAALALGLRRWRIVLRIVLPTAAGGLITGAVLGVARIAGETAPLLFTSSIFSNLGITTNISQAMPNIPVTIFTLSESPSPADHEQALGGGAAAHRHGADPERGRARIP